MYATITSETREWLNKNMRLNSVFYRTRSAASNTYILMLFEDGYSLQFIPTQKCDGFKYELRRHDKNFDRTVLEKELVENCECERFDFIEKYIADFTLNSNISELIFTDGSKLSCEISSNEEFQGCRFNFCGIDIATKFEKYNPDEGKLDKLRKSLPKNVFKAIKKLQEIIKTLPPKECYYNSEDFISPYTVTCPEEMLMEFLVMERDALLVKHGKKAEQYISYEDFMKEMDELIEKSEKLTPEEKELERKKEIEEYRTQAEEGYIRRFYLRGNKGE